MLQRMGKIMAVNIINERSFLLMISMKMAGQMLGHINSPLNNDMKPYVTCQLYFG